MEKLKEEARKEIANESTRTGNSNSLSSNKSDPNKVQKDAKKERKPKDYIIRTKTKKLTVKYEKGFETLYESKQQRHVQTDILDNYEDVRISKDTIYKGKEIYKVIDGSEKYILKVTNIYMNQPEYSLRLRKNRECYSMMKKLGIEHPYFIKAYDRKELAKETFTKVETLMEYGGESLFKLMHRTSYPEIKRWMIQSVDAFMYSEERRICHFDIKPHNLVYNNGILKIIDLDSSIEFDMKDQIYKQMEESGKTAYQYTKLYAPMDASENSDKWIGDKFDVFCWALSFYQIITKANSKEISMLKAENCNKAGYNKISNEIKNHKKFLKIDKHGIIANVIVKCLNYNTKERPSIKEVAVLMKQIDEEVTSEDLQIANANNQIGDAYNLYTNNFKAAKSYLKKSLKIRIEKLGELHTDTAASYTNIGLLHNELGDRTKALKYHNTALSIRIKLLGEQHRDTAESYSNIGSVYHRLGNFREALKYYKESLNIFLKKIGKEQVDTASVYGNIGIVFKSLGQPEKALKYMNESLSIRLNLLGKEHIDTAASYNNFGSVYVILGDSTKALDYYEKALKLNIKLLGEEHKSTAMSYNNIASVYYDLGEKKKALEYSERSLNIRANLLGEEHISTVSSYNNIASAYNDLGDKMKALECLEKALNIQYKSLGEKHKYTAILHNNIGSINHNLGNNKKALECYKKALNIQLKFLDKEHPDAALSFYNIGLIYVDLCDKMKALEYFNKSLKILLKKLGKDHSLTKFVMERIENITNF